MSRKLRDATSAATMVWLIAAGCGSPHADKPRDGSADLSVDRPSNSSDEGTSDAPAGDTSTSLDHPADDDAHADGMAIPPVIVTSVAPLAAATVGIAYMSKIEAQGGVPPYTFTLVGAPAALAWLSIDTTTGVLSGTPAQPTTAPAGFSVAVHDSRSSTAPESIATRAYMLTVNSCKEGDQVDCSGTLAGGAACGFGKSTCTNGVPGACLATTPSTDIARCGGACSSCDVKTAKSCVAGRCKCGAADPCAAGATCCGDGATAACVDTAVTVDNCGGCGVKCPVGGYHCEGGICKCGANGACAAGQTCCGTGTGAACVALQQDRNNCGQCGLVCDTSRSDSCNGGTCHCGGGVACSVGQTCCGGACVDTSSNTANCGRCGNVCQGDTRACLSGTCSCGSHPGACTAGTTCCGDNCYNLSTAASSFNCGVCGHSCLGDPCAAGACQPAVVTGAAAAPFTYPPASNSGITFAGHTYALGYGTAPDGMQDAAIFKDGSATPLCIWTTFSGGGSELSFRGMAADNSFVYGFLGAYGVGLFKCPIDGGTAVTLFDENGLTNDGLVDNGVALYWDVVRFGVTAVYRLVK